MLSKPIGRCHCDRNFFAAMTFDVKAFNDLMQATKTDPDEWAYPVSADVEVRATPQPSGAVIDKLPFGFVRVMPESALNLPAFLRIVTPAGKTGYAFVDSIAPIGDDQICYVRDANGWKIGGGDSQ